MKNKTENISVIILHYNDAQLTKDYIDNLRKLNWGTIKRSIIIVDNNSPDKSGRILSEQYKDDKDVIVILSEDNLGFAKGNNIGIQYAMKYCNPELIVVSNNDIKIDDKNFPISLLEIYGNAKFDVYGPDIYSLGKSLHQNPISKRPYNLDELRKKINDIEKRLNELRIIERVHIYNLLSNIKRALGKKSGREADDYKSRQENIVLHGAFFVLTPRYLEYYPEGLFDKTFLYLEEDILAYRCRQRGLKTLYDPSLAVIHYDGVNSLQVAGNKCRKYIRELEETKRSCVQFIKYIEHFGS